ncbi:nitroreductase family protein [Ktedonobacter racemifer]|uniref:Nitroreductase n=1 Tax=Ktedonobacter racemifer DSM 44963 TaxID=485913 RepID=D6TXZ2_KTERA|nr:nitroreductase family protein [Ktedonobacter racemifer]EFH84988.1 nitroreductase [Ktedonobacter racemifer DSM 44963]
MLLDLSPQELLQTTRAVRKRLDFHRPVETEVLQECLEIALQAPTGSNNQHWHFLVITDSQQRKALGDLYRRGFATYCERARTGQVVAMRRSAQPTREAIEKLQTSSQYLLQHIHEVPVMLIPCIEDRVEGESVVEQANAWGSILPAAWSFMLAARLHGLGTCWTTLHLYYEREAAMVLDIPYDHVMQTALIPIAYTRGTRFRPASRHSLDKVVHWNRW